MLFFLPAKSSRPLGPEEKYGLYQKLYLLLPGTRLLLSQQVRKTLLRHQNIPQTPHLSQILAITVSVSEPPPLSLWARGGDFPASPFKPDAANSTSLTFCLQGFVFFHLSSPHHQQSLPQQTPQPPRQAFPDVPCQPQRQFLSQLLQSHGWQHHSRQSFLLKSPADDTLQGVICLVPLCFHLPALMLLEQPPSSLLVRACFGSEPSSPRPCQLPG